MGIEQAREVVRRAWLRAQKAGVMDLMLLEALAQELVEEFREKE
jgi:tRNA G46 methylase TrmB